MKERRDRTRACRTSLPGAHWDGHGTHFSVYSGVAQRVELCLFDDVDGPEVVRVDLQQKGDFWCNYLPGCRPGTLYGYRVHGPYRPDQGQRCNPHKLLLDPYARLIRGALQWTSAHYGYRLDDPQSDLSFDTQDNAPQMLRSEVVDGHFDWGKDVHPRTPWAQTLIMEVHVKGYTLLHPDVTESQRGTYAGLAHPSVVAHFKSLGVTAIELLPVHAFIDDDRLNRLGLRNYWGYNTLGFFAPEMRYCASGTIDEFKQMVRDLHAAGLEVILDVVYNHTAEGSQLGPTLSLRGFDNAAYYRLRDDEPRFCVDWTGTGNTLNTRHPAVIRLIMDSLRYWVSEMHVDGFRFDLAPALGRPRGAFDAYSGLFAAIAQDPVLCETKLIAEPWDLGEGGYQLGAFPAGWAEWNAAYRDTVRSFWGREGASLGELSRRLSGSSDIFQPSRRGPGSSINFVTVHDGFTLHDLVSYNHKHNEANGEDNRDGESHNRSWNCGAEGDTDDDVVHAMRERQKRNLLTTLLMSQGTPMLLGGDELGRTQRGNNNAYCQDSELSWVDWQLDEARLRLLGFVKALTQLRREIPALRRERFFEGQADEQGHKDISWLAPSGRELGPQDWQQPDITALAALICGWKSGNGESSGAHASANEIGDSVLMLINARPDPVDFLLPELLGGDWVPRIDTRTTTGLPLHGGIPTRGSYLVAGRSMAVLTQPGLPAKGRIDAPNS